MGFCLQHGFLASVFAARHDLSFHTNFTLHSVLALGAGILILVRPKLLNFIVAGYLIAIGIIGILDVHW